MEDVALTADQLAVQERRDWRHGLEMAATDAVVKQLVAYESRRTFVANSEGAK